MKTETAAYTELATKPVLKPRYSIALSFDDADTDVTWLTSHADCLDPFSNNLLDYTQWVLGSTGSQLPNYSALSPADTGNNIEAGAGPDGDNELLWHCIEQEGGGFPSAGASGGFNANFSSGFDHTKTYRYSIWVKRAQATSGKTYLGCSAGTTNNLNGSQNTNPYFVSAIDLPVINKWYLLVGILHGSGYTGSTTNVSGVYDPDTGLKVIAGTEFKTIPGSTSQQHRAYYYYADNIGDEQWMCRPRVDLVDGTEPPLEELLGSEWRIDGCIQGISGQSQKISPDKAQHTIGSITIKIADINGEFSTKIKTKLDGGEGLRKKRIVLYKGHADLTAWSDYGKRLTYLVDGISYKDKVYTLRCSDIQRSTKTDIFDIHQGVLTSTLAKGATTVPITIANAASKFPLVAHDAVYSGNPSTTIGYIKIDDEIIAHSGWTDANYDTLQVVERGALNTVDVEHTVTATEIDKRKKVDEYIYLEMPAAKLIYALLTGNLEGQAATLPTHWHLAIDTKYVTLSDFTGIGSDLWDTTNNTGRIARFMGLKKTAAKAFIEKEILLWLGAYMPVYSDGSYGLRRLENVLPYTSYIAALDANEISSYGELVYDQNSVINNIAIKWNWIDSLDKYAKTTSLIDSNSISKYGVAPLKTYEFKGVFTGNQSDEALQNYFNQIRDRYTAPPLRLKLTVQPQWDRLDVGDIIRVDCSQILDYHTNAELSRSFEIQQITTDWITGKVMLDLFGGVEAATYSPISSSNVMLDSYYTAVGTDLASVLTIVGGAVTASGTINGNSDLTAAGAIYYYDGNLTINSGVTVTINNNVQLRIKGFLTVNGKIDGNGNGVAGVAATGTKDGQFATEGVLKSSLQLESYSVKTHTKRTSYNFQYNGMRYPSMMSLTGKNIINHNGASIDFGITDLRGPGGASGIAAWNDNNSTIISAGVGGGNGGAGLAVICRGVSFGLSAVIDLSGAPGTEPVGGAYSDSNVSGVTVYGGGGQGGGSGSLVILIDGNYSSPLLVDNVTVDDGLDGYAEQADNHKSYYFNATDNVSYGYMPSFLATLDASRKIEYHTLVRYIPVSEIGYVWYPADEEQQVTGYQNKPTDWSEITDKTNTAPADLATVGADWNTNISNYPGDNSVLNAYTQWSDVAGTANAPADNADVTDYAAASADAQSRADIARDIALANAVGANLVKTNIFTDNLFKGDWTTGTVVAISSVAGVSALDGFTHALKLTTRDNYDNTNRIPVNQGDVLYWGAWMNTQATTKAVNFGYRAFLEGVGQSSWPSAVNLAPGTGWTWKTGSLTIPANVTSIAPFLQIDATNTYGEPLVQGLEISRSEPAATRGADWNLNLVNRPADQDILNAALRHDASVTVTVGSGGDYTTINDAIAALTKAFPAYQSAAPVRAEISLLAGFVLDESIIVDGLNLGWITITGVDAETNTTAYLDYGNGNNYKRSDLTGPNNYYFIFVVLNGGTFPVIDQLFTFTGNSTSIRGFVADGPNSSLIIAPGAGIKKLASYHSVDAYAGARIVCSGALFSSSFGSFPSMIIADNGASIICSGISIDRIAASNGSQIDASNCTMVATRSFSSVLSATGGSRINANGTNISQQYYGFDLPFGTAVLAQSLSHIMFDGGTFNYVGGFMAEALNAQGGSTISAKGVDCSGVAGSSSFDINVSEGGVINATGTTGTTNQTVNTITASGVIYR